MYEKVINAHLSWLKNGKEICMKLLSIQNLCGNKRAVETLEARIKVMNESIERLSNIIKEVKLIEIFTAHNNNSNRALA